MDILNYAICIGTFIYTYPFWFQMNSPHTKTMVIPGVRKICRESLFLVAAKLGKIPLRATMAIYFLLHIWDIPAHLICTREIPTPELQTHLLQCRPGNLTKIADGESLQSAYNMHSRVKNR